MPTEASVLARLEKLRKRRTKARVDEKLLFDQLKEELRVAGEIRINGEPINRSLLIEASGLSRRTAYQVLDTLRDDDDPVASARADMGQP